MTLDNDDEIAKAIGESSLDGLSDDGLEKLVGRFDEIPPDVQLSLTKSNPELQKLALEAVSAVEENLKATLASKGLLNELVTVSVRPRGPGSGS